MGELSRGVTALHLWRPSRPGAKAMTDKPIFPAEILANRSKAWRDILRPNTPGPWTVEEAQTILKGAIYCTRCGEQLNPHRAVWLELNQSTGTYHVEGTVPPEKSQGGLPFGKACARRALEPKP